MHSSVSCASDVSVHPRSSGGVFHLHIHLHPLMRSRRRRKMTTMNLKTMMMMTQSLHQTHGACGRCSTLFSQKKRKQSVREQKMRWSLVERERQTLGTLAPEMLVVHDAGVPRDTALWTHDDVHRRLRLEFSLARRHRGTRGGVSAPSCCAGHCTLLLPLLCHFSPSHTRFSSHLISFFVAD